MTMYRITVALCMLSIPMSSLGMTVSKADTVQRIRSELFAACYKGNMEKMEEIISGEKLSLEYFKGTVEPLEELRNESGYISDIALVNRLEMPFLHYASWKGFELLVQRMLEKYPEQAKMRANNGTTAAHFAAENGYVNCLIALLKSEPELLGMKSITGWTVIHSASLNGHRECIELLHGLDPELLRVQDNNGLIGLHVAAFHGHRECIGLLHGLNPELMRRQDNNGFIVLHVAAFNGHRECIELLHGLDSELIRVGANNGYTALLFAASNGHKECIELLHGLDQELLRVRDKNGCTVLHAAAFYGHKECIELLHALDPELLRVRDNDGCTVLHSVALNGHRECLELLHGLDPELLRVRDSNGMTALHSAASSGHRECIELLHALDPELMKRQDNDGCTALHLAANSGGQDASVEWLCRQGYGIHSVNYVGHTPLIVAIRARKAKVIGLLLDAGSDVTFEHAQGLNAWYYCALSCDEELIKIFLRRAYKLFRPIASVVELSGLRLRFAERALSEVGIAGHPLAWIFLSGPLRKDCALMLQGKLILGKPISKEDTFLTLSKEPAAEFLRDELARELERILGRPELTQQQRKFIRFLLLKKDEIKETIHKGIIERYQELVVADKESNIDAEEVSQHKRRRVEADESNVPCA